MLPHTDLCDERARLVARHVEAENDRDLEALMATFTHARYEIVPTGVVFDGDAAVREMQLQQWAALPRFVYRVEAVFHGPDGLVLETRTSLPETDFDMLSINVFGFVGADLVVERCYFDRMLMAAELEKIGVAAPGGRRDGTD